MDEVKYYIDLFIEILQKYPLNEIYNLNIPIGIFDRDYLPEDEGEVFKAGDYFIVLYRPWDYYVYNRNRNLVRSELQQLAKDMIPIVSQLKLPPVRERMDVLDVLKGLQDIVENNSLHFKYSYYCPLDDKVCKINIGEEDECRLSNTNKDCRQMYDSRELVTDDECCFYIDEMIKMMELTRSRGAAKSSRKISE